MSKANLKSFNAAGIERAHALLDWVASNPTADPDLSFLNDENLIEEKFGVEFKSKKQFPNRLRLAKYIHEKLSQSEIENHERNKGLWVWLSMLYFDQLCPPNSKGVRKPGERARWIPDLTSWKRYYRHLIVGPYRIFASHKNEPELLVAILANEPSKSGDLYEQIASRQQLITNRNVVETINRLYFDEDKKKLKRGAGGKDKGGARRLADTLNQFDLTYDLYSVDTETLVSLLPKEFGRFKNQN